MLASIRAAPAPPAASRSSASGAPAPAPAPDRLCVANITHVRAGRSFCYAAFVIDAFIDHPPAERVTWRSI